MKRILFVDDDPRILHGIKRMLYATRGEWELDFAEGGEAALCVLEAKQFDVVVSDIRMPGMDGATLLAKIKVQYPATARIVLSAYSEVNVAMRATACAHQFLSKPCDPAALKSAIARVCALRDVMNNEKLRHIVGEIGGLPSLPKALVDLREAVDNPDTPTDRIVKIVETDMAMAAKILQLVNSAFFGLARPVNSLNGAVNYLGLSTLRSLVYVAETFRSFAPAKGIPLSLCDSIQLHGQRTAEIAAKLPLDPSKRELAIVACLLHDVGSLVFASRLPEQWLKANALAKQRRCKVFEAEEELLGVSHAEVGAYLLGLWGIPEAIVEAVAYHHRPTRIPHSDFDGPMAVYVAHVLAHESDGKEDPSNTELSDYDRECLTELGLLDRLPEFRELIAV